MRTHIRFVRFTGVAIALCAVSLGGACKSRGPSDNPDVAAEYRGDNQYEGTIVTAKKREDYKDQGKGISPKTLRNIEDSITSVYEKDFERCLEEQMGELGTRFVRTAFVVEFHIDTSGKSSKAKILQIQTRKQDAKGSDMGEVSSDGMKQCIVDSIAEWEFDPPPEVEYVHTYRGRVGEAF